MMLNGLLIQSQNPNKNMQKYLCIYIYILQIFEIKHVQKLGEYCFPLKRPQHDTGNSINSTE